MSELAKHIQAFREERTIPISRPRKIPNLVIEERWSPLPFPQTASIYTFKVTWQSTAAVADFLTVKSNVDALTAATATARRQAVEQIFGEFRRPLLDLRTAIENYDMHEARNVLDRLEQQMFDV